MRYDDRTVWITGASSGIGEALARELAHRGARLILSARRVDRLEALKAACEAMGARGVQVLPFDQQDVYGLGALAARADDEHGPIDIAFLNAGITQTGTAVGTELEVLERVLKINFLGTAALARALVPKMTARGSGRLVVTSSLLGKFGMPGRGAYAASKHALHGYFESMRYELSSTNVRVTMLCPGFVRTEILDHALTEDGRERGPVPPREQAVAAELVARKTLDGIERDRAEIYVGGRELAGVWLKRFVPAVFDRVAPRQSVEE